MEPKIEDYGKVIRVRPGEIIWNYDNMPMTATEIVNRSHAYHRGHSMYQHPFDMLYKCECGFEWSFQDELENPSIFLDHIQLINDGKI